MGLRQLHDPVDARPARFVTPSPFGCAISTAWLLAASVAAAPWSAAQDTIAGFERQLLLPDEKPTVAGLIDVNQDGRLDVAVCRDSPRISVFPSLGGGELGPGIHVDLVARPTLGFSADLDGDGDGDLVASHAQSPVLSLVRNVGSGLSTALPIPIPAGTRFVRFGDWNGDGQLDLVALEAVPLVSTTQPLVMPLLQQGAGQFVPIPGPRAAIGSFYLESADLDADGRGEAAAASALAPVLEVFAPGNGSAPAAVSVSVPAVLSWGFALFDIGGDGVSDIVINAADASGSALFGIPQIGPLLFGTPSPVLAGPAGIESTAVGDVNGDGQPEIVARFQIFSTGGPLAVYGRDGAGGLMTLEQIDGVSLQGPCALGDFDQDGRLDFASGAQNAVRIFVSSGTATHSAVRKFTTVALPSAATLADFDRNGIVDAIVAGSGASALSLHSGLAGASFGPPVSAAPLPPSTELRLLESGDVSGDGYDDAVATSGNAPNVWYFKNVVGSFGLPPVLLPTGNIASAVTLRDWNGDGALDLIALSSVPAILTVRLSGSGGLGPAQPLAAPVDTLCFAAEDLNHDGALELVLGTASGMILRSDGSSVGSPIASAPGPVFTIDVFDATEDTIRDIVATEKGVSFSELVVLAQGSNGQFNRSAAVLPVLSQPRRMLHGDLTGDGHTDLLFHGPFPSSLLVEGGVGGLVPAQGLRRAQVLTDPAATPAAAAWGAALADLDADGRLDVVMPSPASSSIAVLRGTMPAPLGASQYGAGTAGCEGRHGIRGSALPAIGSVDFRVLLTQAPRSVLGVLLLADAADAAGSDPYGMGATTHLDFASSTFLLGLDVATDESGFGSAALPIPAIPALAGNSYFAQGLFAWLGPCKPGPFGISTSAGLALTIQP